MLGIDHVVSGSLQQVCRHPLTDFAEQFFGATDNLVKGGAGQAIENMNLVLGLPERASLEDPGPWPP